MRAGGVNLLDPEPARHGRLHQGVDEIPGQHFPGVNTLYNGLLNSPGFDKVDFSKLKTSIGGGMAMQKPVAEKWLKVTGCALSEGYGLSETSPTLTCNPADTDQFSGSIGMPGAVDLTSRSATTTARKCRSARPARSAPRARR